LFDANQDNNTTHYPSHQHPQQHCTMDAADDYDRQLNELIISKVVSDFVAKKNALDAGKKMGRKNNQYGIAVQHLQWHGVVITVDALKQRVSRSIRAQNKPTEVHVAASPSTLASSLTSPTASLRSDDLSSQPEPISITDTSLTSDTARETETITDTETNTKVGRPKGSTNAKKSAMNANLTKCIDAISLLFASERKNKHAEGKRVPKGFLSKLIKEQKRIHGVEEHIPADTIRTRADRNSLSADHNGVKSPLEDVEEYLVETCIQMAKIRQPLNCNEALQLMNSYIDGTDAQLRLIEFQSSRRLGKEGEYGKVTKGW
jgi:hypothetical protein